MELALLKATQSDRFKPFMYNCHGITFFGELRILPLHCSLKPGLTESLQQLHIEDPVTSQ